MTPPSKNFFLVFSVMHHLHSEFLILVWFKHINNVEPHPIPVSGLVPLITTPTQMTQKTKNVDAYPNSGDATTSLETLFTALTAAGNSKYSFACPPDHA
jgi:hypothetical protein